jgi:hypothetical protein
MNFFQSVLGNTPAASTNKEDVSLLADWASYSNQPDIEAAGPSTSETLFGHVDKAGSKVSDLFQSSYSSVSRGVSSGVAALPTAETFRYR